MDCKYFVSAVLKGSLRDFQGTWRQKNRLIEQKLKLKIIAAAAAWFTRIAHRNQP